MIDIHFYSINDFVDVATGLLLDSLRDKMENLAIHLKGCQQCKSRGKNL